MLHIWNKQPEDMVEMNTITTFKNHLEWFMESNGLEGYGAHIGHGTNSVRQFGQDGGIMLKGMFPCHMVL